MATIPITVSQVRVVRADQNNYDTRPNGISGVLERGTLVVEVASGADAGKWIAGAGGGTRKPALAIRRAPGKNHTVTAVRGDALVDLGDASQSLNIGTVVYGTPGGVLDDSATSNFRVGEIVAGYSQEKSVQGTPGPVRRLLRLDA